MRTPWDSIAAGLTRLTDRVDALPSVREATVTGFDPVMVQFDTDSVPVKATGGLSVPNGTRVLTLKLRHYIWIIGVKGAGYPGTLVLNAGTIDHDTLPTSFTTRHITIGVSDADFPAGIGGLVEVIHYTAARTIQRVTYKGDNSVPSQAWLRSASGSGSTWGAWQRVSGTLDSWASISSSFLDASVSAQRDGKMAMIRGSTNTDIPIGTSSTDITSTPIPSEWRPSGNAWGAAYSAGVSATALLRPDGTVAISNRNAIALTGTVFFSITYMLDT